MKIEKIINLGRQMKTSPQDRLNELKDIAEKNGGKLLSTTWRGNKEKYEFSFSNGQEFTKVAHELKKNGWPKSPETYFSRLLQYQKFLNGKNIQSNMEQLKEFGRNRNLKLIDSQWKGHEARYKFEDENGHIVERAYHTIRSWREKPLCSELPDNPLQKLQHFASLKNLKLIDTQWKGEDARYRFEDENGHVVERAYQTIRGWKNKASNKSVKQDNNGESFIAKMSIIAQQRKGKLLSQHWQGKVYQYEFMDMHGEKFECSYSSLLKGQWTPDRGLVSEPICRQALEHIFGVEFVKTRSILTPSVTGLSKHLELDGYNEQLNIAFEYQGFPSHWDEKHKDFHTTRTRDILKRQTCEKLGIILIEIDKFASWQNGKKWDDDIIYNHIMQSIRLAYKLANKALPPLNKEKFTIDFSLINHAKDMIGELKEIATKNNGKLLSTVWQGDKAKYRFAFADGREFEMQAKKIKKKWPENPDKYFNYSHARRNRKPSLVSL